MCREAMERVPDDPHSRWVQAVHGELRRGHQRAVFLGVLLVFAVIGLVGAVGLLMGW